MQIQRGTSKVKASTIDVGNCFIHDDKQLYMRMSDNYTKPENVRDFPIRCVNLCNGQQNGMPNDCMVQPVIATCSYNE